MASCGPRDCPHHAQVESSLSQHLEKDISWLENNDEFSKGRLCNRFGSFPAYYRGRRDFRASCINEATATTSDFKDFRDIVFRCIDSRRPPDSRDGSLDIESGAILVERWQDASGSNKREKGLPHGEHPSMYDLDWRLGSIADFSRELFAGKDVLDLGCNTGKISLIVASLMQARRVMGVDVDATLISTARTEVCDLQRLHELLMAEKGRSRFSQHRKFTNSKVEDNKGAEDTVFCLDKSLAEPRNEELASLSTTPSTVTRVKQRVSCASFQYSSSCVDPRHTSLSHNSRGVRCCRLTPSESGEERGSSCFGKTPSIRSTCVNVSTCPGTRFGDLPSEGIQSGTGLRVQRISASAASDLTAEVTSCRNGEFLELEGSIRPRLTETKCVPLRSSCDIAPPRKRLCTSANALSLGSRFSAGRAGGRNVGGARDETAHCRAGCSECLSAQWNFMSHRSSGNPMSQCAFPYNISFCVADALAGQPWRLPTICRNACSSGSSSASCFCGITEKIREQQQQLGSNTPEIVESVTKPDACGESSNGCHHGCAQIADRTVRAHFEWEKLEGAFDVVICFSLTKWIHLHHGDSGILLLFARLHALLKAGGLLLLEPQDWASYRRARRICSAFKRQLKSIRLCPRIFCSILTRNEACSCSGKLVILKGALSSSATCGVLAENLCETQQTYADARKPADPDVGSCSSHGCPFSLLAMLHPWRDLEEKKALTLVKDQVNQGSNRSAFSRGGCTEIQHEIQHMQHLRFLERRGAGLSASNQLTVKNEWKVGKARSKERNADNNTASMSQESSHANDSARSELELSGHVMPLREESALHCPRALQCHARSIEGELEAADQDSLASSAIFKRRDVTLTSEFNGNQCRKILVKDNLQDEHMYEATQKSCDWHRKMSPATDGENREFRACTSSVVSDEAGTPGEKEAAEVRGPVTRVTESLCFVDIRQTHHGDLEKNQDNSFPGLPNKQEEGETRQKTQPSHEKRSVRSQGTMADRFVYVLQKLSSDFTLCCKQLQECAHAKAACIGMAGTDVGNNATRTQCVRRDPES